MQNTIRALHRVGLLQLSLLTVSARWHVGSRPAEPAATQRSCHRVPRKHERLSPDSGRIRRLGGARASRRGTFRGHLPNRKADSAGRAGFVQTIRSATLLREKRRRRRPRSGRCRMGSRSGVGAARASTGAHGRSAVRIVSTPHRRGRTGRAERFLDHVLDDPRVARFAVATSTRHVSIGRISIPQPRCSLSRAAGCLEATCTASFRSRASIRK